MIPYVLHSGLVLAGCLVFYKILLQKETFFQLNRFVLLACLVLSFSLPLVPIPEQWSMRKVEAPVVVNSTEVEAFSPTTAVLQWKDLGETATVKAVEKQPAITLENIFTWLGSTGLE